MMNEKPFSQACENNKEPILHVLSTVYTEPMTVWEIGSGSGQHACHFAAGLPHILWQPTDLADNLAGIQLWRSESGITNIKAPIRLDVNDAEWPARAMEALFTANTLHIMSWQTVCVFFERLREVLAGNAPVCIYGPFNYQGQFTSASNARFDDWLKNRDPLSGIRDIEKVVKLARQNRLELHADIAMPANNRMLIFYRSSI